jgi:CIC family chloride channel protein
VTSRVKNEELGDFTASVRTLPISGLAMIDGAGGLVGVLTRADIRERIKQEGESVLKKRLGELVRHDVVEAHPDEPLRVVVYKMAEKGITRMPVVERSTGRLLGLASLDDLLKARARHLEEEQRHEQVLGLKSFLPGGGMRPDAETPAPS